MRGAAQSLTAAASGFVVVLLLTVPVVQGQDDWGVTYSPTQICALEGSTVEINSLFSYPSAVRRVSTTVQDTFWFRKEIDGVYSDLRRVPEYSRRVTYHCDNKKCTLTIENLVKSDSDPQIQVNVIQVFTSTRLNCHSSCHLPDHSSYIWYKNEREVHNEQGKYFHLYTFGPEDNYRCAVRGRGDFRSPPVYAPKLLSVSVSPSGEIVEGSSVTLTCSSDANPEAKYTWYNKNRNGNPFLKGSLSFWSIQSSHSGEYYCTAENELGRRSASTFIDVKYPPRIPSVSVSPSGEIVGGSSVTLTCSSDANPAANYTWYKENQTLFQGPEGVYHFTSINSEDRGNYHCKCENHYGQINSSALHVDVQYAPKLLSVSVSPSGEIVEGSSVTLTCSSDANPAANYTWYKENEDSPKATGQIFTITDLRPEHSGNYYCEAQNTRGRRNSTLNLTVMGGAWKLYGVAAVSAIVLAVILTSVFLWIIDTGSERLGTDLRSNSDLRLKRINSGNTLQLQIPIQVK
ncbi:B-cell receptor CD22-like [Seriola dumerili]|uniref:B-cell receptor CD22-like n=1 Tax=Seriola dumerili TaxID=41447 RepID=UPI000BBE4FD2|nr:B-cell receptor CD22-like [Seriola dumerili]